MTIGAGVYNPTPGFAIPRSYVLGIDMYFGANALVVWNDNVCSFQDLSNPSVSGEFVIAPEFIAWSSNRYTLDFLPVEWWYTVSPDPTKIPVGFYCNWGATVPGSENFLVFNIFGVGTVRYRHTLPPAPPDYWRPPLTPE